VTENHVQRRLAAIVMADVVSYSRMMGENEAGTLAAVTRRIETIIKPVVSAHEGRIVKLIGDGVLIEFGSAVNAVKAALDVQDKMQAANAGLAEDRRIVLRIGINLGEIIVQGNDLFGAGINIAARLESIAPAGGIVISGSAYDQVRNKIDAVIDDLGTHSLKNIAEPVRVYRVATGPNNPVTATAKTADKPSIAILPFTNLGDDPEQGYFSDGVTEDIITELSRWRLLSVCSRSASFRYRGAAVDMKQVARELNVRYIVEGSVRRMGDRIRITVQLIDSETGNHVWAEKFDRQSADIFAVQDQVVRTITSTLVGRVQVSDVERARRKPPASLAAYECALKANALSWSDPEGAAEALRLFKKAIAIDPGYGFAHAVLSAMYIDKWYDDTSGSDAALQEAYALAKRAVALDENESTCYSMLGHAYLMRRSHELALQYTRRAVEINPNNQWNAADLGAVLLYIGQAEEALEWFRRSKQIDPYFDPHWYWRAYGQACMILHRYAEALAMFEHLPTHLYRVSALKAGCHARLGDMDRARTCTQECLAAKPDYSIGHFLAKEPFKDPADAVHLAESLRMAGLPDEPRTPEQVAPGIQANAAQTEASWAGDVIRFWFEEMSEADWFVRNDRVDAQIRERFLALHEKLVINGCSLNTTPRELLAAVIVLDQFSRNMFRGSPHAYAADAIARQIARHCIEQGFDRAMTSQERLFLYLPFEHSEDAEEQVLSLKLMTALGNAEWTRHALEHKLIIDRFGRFPHRNDVLNRVSSAEEIEFLKDPANLF
jgi:adenylate cyclase